MIRNPATMAKSYIGTWMLGWNAFFKIVTHPQLGKDGYYVSDVMIYDSNYSFVEYRKHVVINGLREIKTKKDMMKVLFCEQLTDEEPRPIKNKTNGKYNKSN